MGRKKQVRKAEPPSKRGIAWPRWTGFRGMTVRDWLQLLIVPLALVVIGFLFTMQQDARQQALENQRQAQALAIENKRAEAERELAEQRAQDEALQAYLDQMSQLMLERKLLESEQGDPVYTLAQARTSTVILRLDAEHNESVIRFLIDSGLAASSEASPRLLSEIVLSDATLSDANLFKADLSGAVLNGANLSGAFLQEADLSAANLVGTNLSKADLSKADLSGAFLPDADLSGASLFKADLFADLSKADLSRADLVGADLSGAYVVGTNLSEADLSDANLSDAYLSKADLSGAFLQEADLSGAKGITNEELVEQQAKSLEGATMPNGQHYEDWLKDKKAREKDE